MAEGRVLGHEDVGVVEEVGRGRRVVISPITSPSATAAPMGVSPRLAADERPQFDPAPASLISRQRAPQLALFSRNDWSEESRQVRSLLVDTA